MCKLSELPFSRAQILQVLANSITWKDFAQAIGRKQINKRERLILEKKYGIAIQDALKQNKLAEIQKRKQKDFDKIVECANCGRKYRNGDRPSNNKSGRYFCSDICARRFVANSKSLESVKKISNSLKKFRHTHTHEIHCEKCGNPIHVDIWVKQDVCKKCRQILTQSDYRKYKFLEYSRHKPFRTCQICGAVSKKCKHPEICKHILAFPNYVKYLGFNSAMIGTEKVYDEFNRVKSVLYDMYYNQNMSIPEICAELKYPHKTGNFIKLLRHFIQLRSVEDGKRQYMLKHKDSPPHKSAGKNKFFKTGEHITWTGETIIYRSSYELDLCLEFDQAHIRYKVEPFMVEYLDSKTKNIRFAIPDFYLPDYNVIIEVKSKFTLDKQNMLDKINAYLEQGYDFVLEYEHRSFCAEDVQHIQIENKIINDF